ncbi:MAG: cell division protein ZapA [Deltaproteobacteria bacterium]|nr:cell division protein ZapA [Deltaproteobacteria bacterium]
MANRFDVNIAGYALIVQTDRSAEHMERLAETLNDRVREIQKSGGTANYLNVVMLAAMELADDVLTTGDRAASLENEVRSLRQELETLRKEREGMMEKVDRKNRGLLAVLENALK